MSQVEILEGAEEWRDRYARWKQINELRGGDVGGHYPWVVNRRAPFRPARRALPMLNLALVTSAGAYLDGTEPFDTETFGGDASFREIPVEVGPEDLQWTARGYDVAHVREDMNSQLPLDRLKEFEGNGIIGQLNPVFWSISGFIPNAARFATTGLQELVERVRRYEVQAVLLVPAARAIEAAGVPTMTLAVDRAVVEAARPPRAAYYPGEFGCVVGKPNWPEYQRRVLDEALRLIEPIDQPSVRNLIVAAATEVEMDRGER